MVQVRDHHPLHDDGDVCIDQWVTNLLDKVAEGSFSREYWWPHVNWPLKLNQVITI